MSSAKLQKIKFIDAPVENYYSGTIKFDKNSFYECYLSFLLHDDLFSVDDIVLVNGSEEVEVVKILCIYNFEKITYIVARKYLFARNLKDKLANLGFVEFDKNYEVVEDLTKDYVVHANQIIKKCGIVYAHIDDSPYIIKEHNLTHSDFFSCRYYLKSHGISPVLYQNMILSDNFRSSDIKLGSAKKSKSKSGTENTPITYLANSDNSSTENVLKIKMKSPKLHKNKVSPYSSNICSPVQINSVKRNLNQSFGNSPTKSNNSILNYSIISDDEVDNKPLVLRLKKSQRNKSMVASKKVNDNNSGLKMEETVKTTTSLRKSSRAKVRKSYADYISPVKTPTKRKLPRRNSESNVTSEDDVTNFEYTTPVKNTPSRRNQKLTKEANLETPRKSSCTTEVHKDGELKNRRVRTPRTSVYQEYVDSSYLKENNSVKSAKKSMKFTNVDQIEVKKSPGRSITKSKRLNSISLDNEDNNTNIELTPEKKINLDESIRRQILRVHLTESKLAEEINNNQQNNKRKSVATEKFYYESSDNEKTPRKVKWDNLDDDSVTRQILKVCLTQCESKRKTINFESPQKYECKSRYVKEHESSSENEESSENIEWDNLDDSVTRQILKVHLTQCESKRKTINLESPQKYNYKSRSVQKDESSSENEDTLENIEWNTLDDIMRRKMLKIHLTQCESKGKLEINSNLQKDKHQNRSTNYFQTLPEHVKCTSAMKSRTPRTKMKSIETKYVSSDSSDTEDVQPITPKTKRYMAKATPKSRINQTPKTPKTPKNRAKLIRDGIITPTMHSRNKAVPGESTPLMKARSKLHVSYVPTALPCREKEYCDIFNFLEGKLLDGCGGCMYISGVPGTGKTATATSVINNLLQNDDVPRFSYVNINGMRLSEPRQSYVEILKQLTGKTVHWEQAQSALEEKFTKSKNFTPVVMLIDELDILCTKRQDVVYNLLDWPSKAKNQLIVITIANTMDLPERLLMSRVTSRLGLTRLSFQAYTHKQLQEIVTKRLTGTDSFNPDAVQFVARKVASVSGDARRALDICRRAAEIAEAEGKSQLVGMNHVNEALNAMITQPKVRAIKSCSRLEQLILQSIVAEVERTGVEETTFADVFKMLVSCTAIDGFQMVSSTNALAAISRLSAYRLILSDQKCSNINQRIILNVSVDDVYYALKND